MVFKYTNLILITSLLTGSSLVHAAALGGAGGPAYDESIAPTAAGGAGGHAYSSEAAPKWTMTPTGILLQDATNRWKDLNKIEIDKYLAARGEKPSGVAKGTFDVPVEMSREEIRDALEKAEVGDIGLISNQLDTMLFVLQKVNPKTKAIRRSLRVYESSMTLRHLPTRLVVTSGHDTLVTSVPTKNFYDETFYTVDLCTFGECNPDAVLDVNNPVLMGYFPKDWASTIIIDDGRWVTPEGLKQLVRILKPGSTMNVKLGNGYGVMHSGSGGDRGSYEITEDGRQAYGNYPDAEWDFVRKKDFRAKVLRDLLVQATAFYTSWGAKSVELNRDTLAYTVRK